MARLEWPKTYHEHTLRAYAETREQSETFAHGRILIRKGREQVEIADPDVFCARNQGTVLVHVKEEPDKTEVAKQIKATGEIPEGADWIRGETTRTVETL